MSLNMPKNEDNKIIVKCGYFTGNIDEFIDKVKTTHGDNEHGRAYLQATEIAKIRIKPDKEASKG